MFNVGKVYEWLFHSFRIEGIETLIQTLEQENITQCIIIKRSWIYGLYVSSLWLIIAGVMGIQIFLIFQYPFSDSSIDYFLTGLILFNILHIFYASILYLIHFYTTHKSGNNILDITSAGLFTAKETKIFALFFNQITLGYFFFIFLALVETGYLLFFSTDYSRPQIWIQIVSLALQIGLIAYYRRRIMDLHMDYVFITPDRLYFVDQIGVHRSQQTMKLMKDILIIKGGYPNIIASFLDYGTIEMSVKFDREIATYDTPDLLDKLHMHYVLHPIKTANDMNKLLTETNNPIARQ